MRDLIKNKYLTKKNAKKLAKSAGKHGVSFGVGAGKTMKDLGLTLMEGAAGAARFARLDPVADALDRDRGKIQSRWDETGVEKRARTKMGYAGQMAVAAVPAVKPARAAGAIAKMAVTVNKMKKFPQAVRELQRLKNSERGRKAAETYRRSLPKTVETVEYPAKPIYPSRSKYRSVEELLKAKKKKGTNKKK